MPRSRWSVPREKPPREQPLPTAARYSRASVNGIKGGKSGFAAPRSPAHVQGQLGAQHAHGAGGALRGQLDTALLGHRGRPGHPRVPRPLPAGIYKARLLGGDQPKPGLIPPPGLGVRGSGRSGAGSGGKRPGTPTGCSGLRGGSGGGLGLRAAQKGRGASGHRRPTPGNIHRDTRAGLGPRQRRARPGSVSPPEGFRSLSRDNALESSPPSGGAEWALARLLGALPGMSPAPGTADPRRL